MLRDLKNWALRYFLNIWVEFKHHDRLLLFLCIVANVFGLLAIASATKATTSGPFTYLVKQIAASILGILLYATLSSVDIDLFSEHRSGLVIFNVILLLLLLPFGTDHSTGNRSWIDVPFISMDIQPAEICKISFIIIMASVMTSHQSHPSSFGAVFHALWHLFLIVGLNMALSSDLGVSLIFVFIFAVMLILGGLNFWWILGGLGAVAVAGPLWWFFLAAEHQKNRIAVLFNPSLDAAGTSARYHAARSLKSLTGGGFLGQGLFQGTRTQTQGALFAQHTDFIFSAIGEELGFVGCACVVLLLAAIVVRCVIIGHRSSDYLRRMICYGVGAALTFQIIINVGMCIGVMPVIGLTLPFFSYGGSSLVSMYAMMGLVSGVKARPKPRKLDLYIRPPLHYGK